MSENNGVKDFRPSLATTTISQVPEKGVVIAENYERNTPEVTPDNDGDAPQFACRLDPRQLQAVVALAQGETETAAARLVGVNRTTIYRWHQNADFVAELNRLKRENLLEHRAKLRRLLDKATETLEGCLQREELDPIKIKAAMFLLAKFAPRVHEPIGPITPKGVETLRKRRV